MSDHRTCGAILALLALKGDGEGVIALRKLGIVSIPAEVGHLLKGRDEWEEHYLPRLQFDEERVAGVSMWVNEEAVPFVNKGVEHLQDKGRDCFYGLVCGCLFGFIRSMLCLVGVSYLLVDDEDLYDEIIETMGDVCYRCVRAALEKGGAEWDNVRYYCDRMGSAFG